MIEDKSLAAIRRIAERVMGKSWRWGAALPTRKHPKRPERAFYATVRDTLNDKAYVQAIDPAVVRDMIIEIQDRRAAEREKSA
jgi:hypothetical protein